MSDIEDAQLKTEIDEIMKGVKNIMQKIDALTPKNEAEPANEEDPGESSNLSDISSTGSN